MRFCFFSGPCESKNSYHQFVWSTAREGVSKMSKRMTALSLLLVLGVCVLFVGACANKDKTLIVYAGKGLEKAMEEVKAVIIGIKTSQKHRFKTGRFRHNTQLCASEYATRRFSFPTT